MGGRARAAALLGLVLASGCRQILGIKDLGFSASSAGGGGSGGSGAVVSSASSTGTGGSGGAMGTGGGAPVCPDHIVISEIRTRGPLGGDDDFVELYNPTGKAIVLNNSWTLFYQTPQDPLGAVRWQGTSGFIPAHGHYLIAGSSYGSMGELPARDAALSAGIADVGALSLMQDLMTIDVVCFAYTSMDLGFITTFLPCQGSGVLNPHDNTPGTDSLASLNRAPLDCTDTDMSDVDWVPQSPSTPQSSTSPPVVY